MKIAICDDEKLYVEKVHEIVCNFFATQGIEADIKTFSCGEDLVNCEDVFDIVFLDIEMGKMNGIATTQFLNKKSRHTKIFIFTSYNQYLDDAMDLQVFRYIDKISSSERIVSGLKKAVESLQSNDIYITIAGNEKIIISKNDIVYVEVKYKKVYVQTISERYVVREKMEFFKNVLNTFNFAVPHSSFIINLEYVTKVKRASVELNGIYNISIAPKRQAEFKKKFVSFMGDGYGIINSIL